MDKELCLKTLYMLSVQYFLPQEFYSLLGMCFCGQCIPPKITFQAFYTFLLAELSNESRVGEKLSQRTKTQ